MSADNSFSSIKAFFTSENDSEEVIVEFDIGCDGDLTLDIATRQFDQHPADADVVNFCFSESDVSRLIRFLQAAYPT